MRFQGRAVLVRLAMLLVFCSPVVAQQEASSGAARDDLADVEERLRTTQRRLTESEDKLRELSSVVADLQREIAALKGANGASGGTRASSPAERHQVEISDEEWQLLNAKVEEHQQVKVESSSKFRLKLSGMFLLNVFGNSGVVDEIDLPRAAYPRPPLATDGTFGASLRQSIVTLTGYGPNVGGARTSADLQVDFLGGLPSGYSGYSSGIARLRLARMRLDWDKTSVVGGLDTLFFSPNSPTSYSTVGEPALAAAGNPWSWTPTVRVERRADLANVEWKFEGGILDYSGYTGYYSDVRYATPGESSKQPAYAIRISGNGHSEDHPISFGVAGVIAPQRYPGNNTVNGWGSLLDWKTPLAPRLELSGEFFAGKGLGGFGGIGLSNTQVQSYQYLVNTAPLLAKLSTIGGWSQLKLRATKRNEFNVAAGYGGLKSADLRSFALLNPNLAVIPARNETLLMNYIFKPRSDLVFSLEYRRLRTFLPADEPYSADHVGASAGFIF